MQAIATPTDWKVVGRARFRYTQSAQEPNSPYFELSWALPYLMTEARPSFIGGDSAIRVLVADHSRIHTRLLADALKRDPLLEVIPFESESSGLIGAVVSQEIDVLVISSDLDELPSKGLNVLQQMHTMGLHTRSVILLVSSGEQAILDAVRAGAKGIFSKNDPLERLTECVRSVYQGRVWANDHALAVAFDALSRSPGMAKVNASGMKLLSKREMQVVQSMAEGLTNREIAAQLNLSQHTVKNYLFRIFDKMGVSSRIELLSITLRQPELESGSRQKDEQSKGKVSSQQETEFLEKSAEAGLPAAQLALAQTYLLRRRDPQDLVLAYMWYLVATERALMNRGFVTKLLTPEQIEEAKRKASAWLAKFNRSSGPRGPVPALPSPDPGEATEFEALRFSGPLRADLAK